MNKLGYLIFALIICFSCNETPKKEAKTIESIVEDSNHPYYVTDLEYAHEKDEFFKNEVVCFNLDLKFGSRNSLMKIFSTTNSSAIRVDKQDGTTTVLVDGKIYTNADSTKWAGEKFSLFTYQYFFMAPYKFSDSGTKWKQLAAMDLEGKKTDRAILTFEEGTGDSPNDWYIVHSDPENKLVSHIGYIVTGRGRSAEEAEKNAHAIKYSGYKQVGNIPMSTKWDFFDYNKEEGLGKQVGSGVIRNIELMDNVDQFNVILDDGFKLIN